MGFRNSVNEQDLAGFTRLEADEYAGYVVKSERGTLKPMLVQSDLFMTVNHYANRLIFN